MKGRRVLYCVIALPVIAGSYAIGNWLGISQWVPFVPNSIFCGWLFYRLGELR